MSDDSTQRFNRRTFLKATGVAGAAAATSGITAATPGREPGPKEDEVLVGVSAGKGDIEQTVSQYVPGDAEVVHKNENLRYVAVKFPSANSTAQQNFIDAVTKKDGIKYAEVNETLESQYTPNDPQFGDQYAPQQVQSDDAWDTTLGDSSVTIAVVDTGAQYDHPDLSGNFESDPGYDFVDNDSDPYPDVPSDEYHGTHVSGCAAAVVDNDTGVAGQGNTSLINGRALDEDGSGSTSDIADAVEWAADQGAEIINMSLGGGGYTDTMKNAVSYASDNGSLPICAAGNDGTNSVSYPAAYSECVAISAVDSSENLASFSNYGDEIELAAPGVDILSTTTETRGSYEKLSGTSMATPVTSGVAGLTLAKWDLTNSELRSHLKNTAKDIGLSSDKQGSGQVNAYNAVTTDPSDGGGGGGDGDSTTSSVSGTLDGYWDYDDYSYGWEYSSPSKVEVVLDGPSDADFDLYINTGTTENASPSNYDYSSTSTDSQESITIDSPDDSTDMQIDVDSYSGSGDYTLTVTEYQ
ncbi:S8 family serine peptidase [Halorussus salinisoli]|uniref:S8 family serine peptidase n=1 Tax=Halorussus salinisoli TaxID=2558242 RepID=UPI0010C21AA5|nr:S8 family serine peptidase [Halorussus salinisoli]